MKEIHRFNEICPLGMLPHERVDWMVKYYNELERRRMEAWGVLQEIRQFSQAAGLSTDGIPNLDSIAEFKNGILKITVKDYLPRKCLMLERGAITQLSGHWLGTIRKALDELDVKPKFAKAEAVIVSYVPHNRVVDPDNLAFKIMLDALRYNEIIADDSINELAFRVEGRVDKENPRTEMYVYEYRDILEKLGIELYRG